MRLLRARPYYLQVKPVVRNPKSKGAEAQRAFSLSCDYRGIFQEGFSLRERDG